MAKIKIRRDTAANWAAANPILSDGEQGRDTTNKKTKTGDGLTTWNLLEFDKVDYGDVTGAPAQFSGSYNDLTDKPALFSGDFNDLQNIPALTVTEIDGGTAAG